MNAKTEPVKNIKMPVTVQSDEYFQESERQIVRKMMGLPEESEPDTTPQVVVKGPFKRHLSKNQPEKVHKFMKKGLNNLAYTKKEYDPTNIK